MEGFFEFFTKIAYKFYLSFLWFICSIPIITIGASTTAYCYMLFKLKNNEEGYIAKGFFKAFKENFSTSTKVWAVLFVAIIVVYGNYMASATLIATYGGMYNALIPAFYLLLLLLVGEIVWIFPYMARFNNEWKTYLLNAFLMSTRHLGYTVTTIVFDVLIILCGTEIFLPVLLLIPMLIGNVNVSMINVIFKRFYIDVNNQ